MPRVQVVPPSNEYARKILFALVFEMATRLFVLVGLTFTKLSAWLPSVALTFTTASVQTNGTNRLLGSSARSLGFMHLRVPSGTSMASGPSTRACKVNVGG